MTAEIPRYIEIVNELGGYVCGVVSFSRSEKAVRDRIVEDPKYAQAVLYLLLKRCIPLVEELNEITARDVAAKALAKATVESAIDSAILDLLKEPRNDTPPRS